MNINAIRPYQSNAIQNNTKNYSVAINNTNKDTVSFNGTHRFIKPSTAAKLVTIPMLFSLLAGCADSQPAENTDTSALQTPPNEINETYKIPKYKSPILDSIENISGEKAVENDAEAEEAPIEEGDKNDASALGTGSKDASKQGNVKTTVKPETNGDEAVSYPPAGAEEAEGAGMPAIKKAVSENVQTDTFKTKSGPAKVVTTVKEFDDGSTSTSKQIYVECPKCGEDSLVIDYFDKGIDGSGEIITDFMQEGWDMLGKHKGCSFSDTGMSMPPNLDYSGFRKLLKRSEGEKAVVDTKTTTEIMETKSGPAKVVTTVKEFDDFSTSTSKQIYVECPKCGEDSLVADYFDKGIDGSGEIITDFTQSGWDMLGEHRGCSFSDTGISIPPNIDFPELIGLLTSSNRENPFVE